MLIIQMVACEVEIYMGLTDAKREKYQNLYDEVSHTMRCGRGKEVCSELFQSNYATQFMNGPLVFNAFAFQFYYL